MLIAELAALSAAFCWALSGLISIGAIRKLGPLAFNRVRMSLVFLLLAGISLLTGAWREFPVATIQTLMISGLIGIFLGDTALFGALQRLGPSRTSVVFAQYTDDGDYGLVYFGRTSALAHTARLRNCNSRSFDCHFGTAK